MCGLAGFTRRQPGVVADMPATLDAMLGCIAHRGPDQQGTWISDGLALAHNRLSIMEPQGGRQPRIDEASGNALIYNGEIYGHHRFDAEIARSGHALRDRCDTETLFWLLAIRGVEQTLRAIDGMFAFAYFDARRETLYLARDEFGQKPMYYADVGGDLVFASELAALRRHPRLQRATPDLDALSLFLMMEYVPGERTGIAGVRELPPGHLLTWRRGEINVAPWVEPQPTDPDESLTEDEAVAELERLLRSAVEQQLVADVPVGVFLSGGLDSSLIAALARQGHPDVATFTVKFDQASFDESTHAEAVARHLGTRHDTIELSGRNCADAFEELVAAVDMPLADSSLLPTYLLCRATRRHVTVALGGDGADELFVGYPNFRLLRVAPLLALLPEAAGTLLRGVTDRLPASHGYMDWRFLARQLGYGVGRAPRQQSILWMSAVGAPEQGALWQDRHDVRLALYGDIETQLRQSGGSTTFEQWRRHFLHYYLGYDILQKTDRAAMYVSLEVRSPYLASDVARFARRLPQPLLLRAGKGKHVLRRLAVRYLPAAVIDRRKHGFAMPVGALLRGEFRDVVAPVLLDRGNPMYGFLHFDPVRRLWEDHSATRRERGKALWALFMLAVFCRRHF